MGSRSIGEPGDASVEASGDRLDRNLAALGMGSPDLARRIAETPGHGDIEFVLTDEGRLSGSLTDQWGRRCQLASRRRPTEEAERLASRVAIERAAVIVVNGFAMGHHVRAILARAKSSALVMVYEPDVALLRGVLERQDHAAWLWDPLLRFVTDASDVTAIGQMLDGAEGLVSLGVEIMDHPPSEQRLGDGPSTLATNLAKVVRSIRTNVITTLSQADVTIRNQLMNLDRYVAAEGIAPLQGACGGRPAIVISAGPSIKRNIHLLEQSWVRENMVLVAVQTMLKPLLERGIRPHFVTALDYHEISTRFYEGLTADDVEGVTLIAEAKGNAAILDAWPGALRCPADPFLGELLSEDASARGAIKAGATVAHLAYYVARYLGCDPVMLVGQDLGFTDGQYYGPGAAIHTVWGSELGEFCTLESLEWQRIKRMGPKLVTAADHLGRPVFTDEQMQTYRLHFEREFQADSEHGLTIIDATEGGVAKAHTQVMPLSEVIAPYRDAEPVAIEQPRANADEQQLRHAIRTLRDARGDVWKIADFSRRSKTILEEMIDHADDQPRVNGLIRQVYGYRDTVKSLQPAWELVQRINQRGTLKRAKADRGIHLADESALDRQKAQMRRDAENLDGLVEAADELGSLMDSAVRAHEGRAPKITREAPRQAAASSAQKPAVWAAITVDPGRSDLGVRRDLSEAVCDGKSALRLVVERLASVRGIVGVALATAHPGNAASAAGIDPAGGIVNGVRVVIVEVDDEPIRDRRRAIRGARAFTPHQWRGGIAGWTYIDELTYPDALCDVLDTTDADALLLCGSDWALVDPIIGEQMLDRFAESPAEHKLVFSQSAVGLSPALLERSLLESMREKRVESGAFASIGTIMGYLPIQPANDPIAGTGCIAVEPLVRDLGERMTADTRARREKCGRIFGMCPESSSALAIARVAADDRLPAGPEHVVLNLVGVDGSNMDTERAVAIVREVAEIREDAVVTLTGERCTNSIADVLDHPHLARIAHAAAGAGALAVHVRTPALAPRDAVLGLLDLGLDAISLEVVANEAHAYEFLTGRDGFDRSRDNIQGLIGARNDRVAADGVPLPWLVARITRRDAIYEQIDEMYDRWLLACGAAVLDPLPEPVVGERIEPLPVPELVARRLAGRELVIMPDLTTRDGLPMTDGVQDTWRVLNQAADSVAGAA